MLFHRQRGDPVEADSSRCVTGEHSVADSL
jgi:hypothetical protein